ncbi:MAG TPA: hypothetical protein VK841_22715 [Polyangiaceae bacterium]|jgi:uncharacterized protein (TIGR02270 family)|nr:hypothetical protein [Polyangiaceae bacterium]
MSMLSNWPPIGPRAPGAPAAADAVLWPVMEEHLAEAASLFDSLERAYDSPRLTLEKLARGVEARWLAHIDGLLVGGRGVYETLLRPILEEPDPGARGRVAVAAAVAVAVGACADLSPSLRHERREVRDAVVDACAFAGGPAFDAWLEDLSGPAGTDMEQVTRARLMARRGLPAPSLVAWLQGGDLALAREAARAARGADARRHLPVIEYAIEQDDAELREAALVAGILWGSPRARHACRARAREDFSRPLPILLLGVLGEGPWLADIAAKAEAPSPARWAALFGLGISGDSAAIDVLFRDLEGNDGVLAKVAAQSLSLLLGIDLRSDALVASAEKTPLPTAVTPLPREAELPDFDPVAVRRACEARRGGLPRGVRILEGRRLTNEALVDVLIRAPMRRREPLAMLLAASTGGRVRVDVRTKTSKQLRALAAAKAAVTGT